MKKYNRVLFIFCIAAAMLFLGSTFIFSEKSPVTDDHITKINKLFKQNSVPNGYAALDTYGRIELMGEYSDEKEVDRAFSLAQTVVGVKWVSPVTPENIKVKEWERRMTSLFSRAKVLKPEVREIPPPVKPGRKPEITETTPPVKPGLKPEVTKAEPPVKPVKKRYALIVGVGEFKHGITPLKYSVKDAMSFYQFLTDPQRGGFQQKDVTMLTDEKATRNNIAKALDKIRSIAEENDLVTIYFSSHGTPPDKFGGVHIVTYDTEVKPRENVWHSAITENMFKEFIENLKSKRLIIILDTCYSNGAYSKVPGFLPPGGKSLGADEDEGYGISKAFGKRLLGAKDIVAEDETPSKSLYSQGDSGYGKVLISASGAGEKSWESNSLNNSIFTYYFLEGLRTKNGSVKDAFFYSKPIVAQRVKQEKGSDIEQNPQVLATNKEWDMKLIR